MTDLRDQLADDITCDPAIPTYADAQRIANRLIAAGWRPGIPPRTRTQATCHPDRPVESRTLCKPCYHQARDNGSLDQYPLKHGRRRSIADVVDMWQLLRPDGATRRTVAAQLGMTPNAFDQAFRRAVRAGLIPRTDRRTT